MPTPKRIGILTGGGDCPGLNAVIRAVVRSVSQQGIEVLGIKDGYRGLVEGEAIPLGYDDVKNLLTQGGSTLGSSNKDNPFQYLDLSGPKPAFKDRSATALANAKRWGLQGLVVLGGDGTMKAAGALAKLGLPCIGVPKTIDNDVWGTDQTFGFDTAVSIAVEALDRLHTTASTHHRAMVVEVMGRTAGWLALAAGLASGADVILIPEIPCKASHVYESILKRKMAGRTASIIVVGEGAKLFGKAVVQSREKFSVEHVRLGGVGPLLAERIQAKTGVEARAVVLGHVVRGGTPTAYDRNLATTYGVTAGQLAAAGRWNRMVALRQNKFLSIPLSSVSGKTRLVPLNHPWIHAARATGASLGC